MRRRLLRGYLTLITIFALALAIPLAASYAMNEYHHLVIRQLNETSDLAVEAREVVTGRRAVEDFRSRLRDYQDDNGVAVALVDTSGEIIAASDPDVDLYREPRWSRHLATVLQGERVDSLDFPYTLNPIPVFIAVPLKPEGVQRGALVTITPVEDLRESILQRLAILAIVAALGIGLAAVAVEPLIRWILKPVTALDDAVGLIAAGNHHVRAPVNQGPPELRRLARTVNSMADRLTTLLALEQSFVGDAAHQLRNPLTALRLRIDNIRSLVPAAERTRVEAASDQVDRLTRILEDLLALARAESETPKTSTVDVARVAEGRIRAWAPLADECDVTVTHTGNDGHHWRTAVVEGTVEQILDVLLDNALAHSPRGSSITLRLQRREDMLEIHVIDSGPGMTEEEKANAANRFWRGRTAESRRGTGLGLSIAEALALLNNGHLRFLDAESGGLDAVVSLPLDTVHRAH